MLQLAGGTKGAGDTKVGTCIEHDEVNNIGGCVVGSDCSNGEVIARGCVFSTEVELNRLLGCAVYDFSSSNASSITACRNSNNNQQEWKFWKQAKIKIK